jgi:hypothetical protein
MESILETQGEAWGYRDAAQAVTRNTKGKWRAHWDTGCFSFQKTAVSAMGHGGDGPSTGRRRSQVKEHGASQVLSFLLRTGLDAIQAAAPAWLNIWNNGTNSAYTMLAYLGAFGLHEKDCSRYP